VKCLPPAVEHVVGPVVFSVTNLAFAESCLLRGLLASSEDVPRLIHHPSAVLGRVLHELVEIAAQGRLPGLKGPEEEAAELLESLLAKAQLDSSNGVSLPSILQPIAWRRKRRQAIDLATLCAELSKNRKKVPAAALPKAGLPRSGTWSEVGISASTLRLTGRIDLFERDGDHVSVHDIKSGRVVDSDGRPLRHIARQLELYGVMVLESLPAAQISLFVRHEDVTRIDFDTATATTTRDWALEIGARVPPNQFIVAESVATPGEACNGCSFRHVCPSYRKVAPQWWRNGSAHRIPLDTWGTVKAVGSSKTGSVDLTLVDAAGRVVRIANLRLDPVDAIRPDDRFWAFGLLTDERSSGGPQPINFYQVSDGDPHHRAWSLEAFRE
jgi:hypothetical protein